MAQMVVAIHRVCKQKRNQRPGQTFRYDLGNGFRIRFSAVDMSIIFLNTKLPKDWDIFTMSPTSSYRYSTGCATDQR